MLKKPIVASFFGHGLIALWFTFAGLGAEPDLEAAQPVPVELVVISEPGVLDDPLADGEPDSVEAEDLELAKVPEPTVAEEQIDQAALPDDLTYVDKPIAKPAQTQVDQAVPDVPQSASKPVVLPEVPETASDLALIQPEAHNAVFNPDGEADADAESAAQSRADTGSSVEEANESPDVETAASAVQESASTKGDEGFLLTSTGGDVPLPRFKPNVVALAAAAEKLDLDADEEAKRADAGIEAVTPKDSTSKSDEGTDEINTAKEESAPDSKKVTTPLPKPKPRALAQAAKEQKRQEEQRQLAAIQPEESEPSVAQPLAKDKDPQDEELTNALNDQVLAILNEQSQPLPNQETDLTDLVQQLEADPQPQPQPQPTLAPLAQTASTVVEQQGASALSILSPDEVDRIASQISNAWYIPPGTELSTVPSITLRVEVGIDGSIVNVAVKDQVRYANDSAYRYAADGAIASVLSTSPWDVPVDLPYEAWRFFEPTFELADFMGN